MIKRYRKEDYPARELQEISLTFSALPSKISPFVDGKLLF